MNEPMPLFLVGPRASGKTTLGRELARVLGWSHVDTDAVVTACGDTVAALVAREGWEGFRKRESEALRVSCGPHRVISTGGGMVLAAENRRFMQAHGIVLYTHAPAEVLAERLKNHPESAQRPSLTGKHLMDEVTEVLALREPLYREIADVVLDATLPLPALLVAAMAALK